LSNLHKIEKYGKEIGENYQYKIGKKSELSHSQIDTVNTILNI